MNLSVKSDCCSKRKTIFLQTNDVEYNILKELLTIINENEKTRTIILNKDNKIVLDIDDNQLKLKKI